MTRPIAAHGGLVHPAEPMPRSVPDGRSLRLRAAMHAPFVALLCAVALAARRRPHELAIQRRAGRWVVLRGGEVRGGLLDLLDGFGVARGWIVARREQGGLDGDLLFDATEAIGLVRRVGRHATLDEVFFAQLATDPEEIELHAVLSPLADAVEAFLEDAT